MRALNAAPINGDLSLERGVDRLARIVPQRHVFGRDRGVGFQHEQPMTAVVPGRQQRFGRTIDRALQIRVTRNALRSWRTHCRSARNERGGTVAGADRAFDGGR